MPFTDEDRAKILDAYDARVSQIRGDYFDYFCHVALEFYVHLVETRKEELMNEMLQIAGSYPHPKVIRVPIHTFETYVSPDKTYQHTLEDTLGKPGAYFKSPTGMNRANMHAIFRYSNFNNAFEATIAPGMFPNMYVSLTSKTSETSSMLTVYSNTMWLNLPIQY